MKIIVSTPHFVTKRFIWGLRPQTVQAALAFYLVPPPVSHHWPSFDVLFGLLLKKKNIIFKVKFLGRLFNKVCLFHIVIHIGILAIPEKEVVEMFQ